MKIWTQLTWFQQRHGSGLFYHKVMHSSYISSFLINQSLMLVFLDLYYNGRKNNSESAAYLFFMQLGFITLLPFHHATYSCQITVGFFAIFPIIDWQAFLITANILYAYHYCTLQSSTSNAFDTSRSMVYLQSNRFIANTWSLEAFPLNFSFVS